MLAVILPNPTTTKELLEVNSFVLPLASTSVPLPGCNILVRGKEGSMRRNPRRRIHWLSQLCDLYKSPFLLHRSLKENEQLEAFCTHNCDSYSFFPANMKKIHPTKQLLMTWHDCHIAWWALQFRHYNYISGVRFLTCWQYLSLELFSTE